MKLSDMIVSAVLKKGILYEARKVDVEFTIPREQATEVKGVKLENVKIHFTADHMSLKIEKDKDESEGKKEA
jgi:hypothetical protein